MIQNDAVFNWQMHSYSDAHQLKIKSTPSKIFHFRYTRGIFSPVLPLGINYTTSGYMFNADGRLMDQFLGSNRFLMF